jgi:tRNA(fMet)-specific endonuclease VapC
MLPSDPNATLLTHLLDTGWIIRHLRGSVDYTQSMQRVGSARLAVSIVSVAELSEGIYRSQNPHAARRAVDHFLSDKTILELTPQICDRFGQERARLRGANLLIGDMDLFIAATCLHHGLTLLTTNARHFERLPDLTLLSDPRSV